ncbi:DMT family transporter [Pararhizobium arenae]|uniref:DMT family transporter n=1 Tax=Pararhizobium arenae TaxID=1856850 RepID=UPI00094B2597|nr:DMT family transporter [Pararhizobium arenae]
MANERRGQLEMIAAMLISGTIGWFVVMSGLPVIDVVFWRCAIGAVVLALICWSLGLFRKGALSRRTFAIAVAGGVAIVLNWLLLFSSYNHASISIATMVYNTQPFMLLGLGVLFLGEKVTGEKLFWLGLSFLGMLAIVEGKSGGGDDYIFGILLALGAAFFYSLAALAAKKLKGTPPHLIALIQVITGTVMLAPLANLSELQTSVAVWSNLLLLGGVHTGLMYVLLYGAIQKLPTHLTGALSFLYPVVAILVDRFALGHQLQPVRMVGSAVILLAAAGVTLGWRPGRLLRRRGAAGAG